MVAGDLERPRPGEDANVSLVGVDRGGDEEALAVRGQAAGRLDARLPLAAADADRLVVARLGRERIVVVDALGPDARAIVDDPAGVAPPAGRTSHSRTATSAFGRSTARPSVTSGKPTIASGSGSGAEVKHSDRPSSARWSSGSSPDRPYGHQTPPSSPTDCGPRYSRR